MQKNEPEHLCSNCALSTPVTDKWLAARTRRPTLAHCAKRRYLVIYDGRCVERDPMTGREYWKNIKTIRK